MPRMQQSRTYGTNRDGSSHGPYAEKTRTTVTGAPRFAAARQASDAAAFDVA